MELNEINNLPIMKTPKASDYFKVEAFNTFENNLDGFFIAPSINNEGDFETEEEAQNWLNELDRLEEYKAQVKGFICVINEILDVRNDGYKFQYNIIDRLKQALKETE